MKCDCVKLTSLVVVWLTSILVLIVNPRTTAQTVTDKSDAANAKSDEYSADVMVPMRDGVNLAANVFLPRNSANQRYPAILLRTPYGKPGDGWGEAERYTRAGYVVVVQDCRGRGSSEGLWDPFRYDAQDGFDTQQWVAQQTWSNGELGTMGGSYVGWTQWASAADASPHLKAMVPVVPFSDVYQEIMYPGGAFQLALAFGWGTAVGGVSTTPGQLAEALRHLPLQNWDSQFGRDIFFLDQWVAHPTYDDYWKRRGIQRRYDQVTVPVLNIGGWYDIFSKTTIEQVDRVRSTSRNRLVRRNQFVVMGPWGHGVGARQVGQLDYGDAAALDWQELQFQWFEYWLRGQETGVEDWPAYLLFVMGENRWRGEAEWPLKRTQFTPYYLSSKGHANSRDGDGILTTQPPGEDVPDQFAYDPQQPVPTRGGNNLVGASIGPFDQSEVEQRQDVLVYTSDILSEPLEVTGPVTMVLYAASSATDTDFTAKLVDVHPDGQAFNLCDGIIRARYRASETKPELIEPGQIYRYEIDLWVTSNVFLPGHRFRVEVASSNFPRFDRNPNTGKPFGSDSELQIAAQTIYHDAQRASYLRLPIIPRP